MEVSCFQHARTVNYLGSFQKVRLSRFHPQKRGLRRKWRGLHGTHWVQPGPGRGHALLPEHLVRSRGSPRLLGSALPWCHCCLSAHVGRAPLASHFPAGLGAAFRSPQVAGKAAPHCHPRFRLQEGAGCVSTWQEGRRLGSWQE